MKRSSVTQLGLAAAGGIAAVLSPFVSEMRVRRPAQPLTDRWQRLPVAACGETLLGISVRTPQLESLGLDAQAALQELCAYPFQLIRLGAYWSRIEPSPGSFEPGELDRQVEAAERAAKQIILCVGPLKTFGYPEFFVPAHQLRRPLPEGSLVEPADCQALLCAGTAFATRIVERYRDHSAIVAWQVEHEAVDALGLEHSWRLSAAFVQAEVDAVRAADPIRPVMMNGFLPTSLPVRLMQWQRSRDQGDSLAVALRLADIVGIDFYPRHAVKGFGERTLYLDGSRSPWQQRLRQRLFEQAAARGKRVMIAEGQAEPWEAVTVPPSLVDRAMYSCLPERVIENYNQCMRWSRQAPAAAYAYLFWGAEYWLRRQQDGDPSYLRAFARVLDNA